MKLNIKTIPMICLSMLSVISCGAPKNEKEVFDKELMNNYRITKKEYLMNQKVYQTSVFLDTSVSATIDFTINWRFETGPALFF